MKRAWPWRYQQRHHRQVSTPNGHRCRLPHHFLFTSQLGKERKERKQTCIAPIVSISTTKCSDVDHTRVTCKYTTSAFPSYKYSLECDTAANSVVYLATDILLIPNPTEGRRLSGLVG